MDPATIAAGIKAGASVVGGILGKNKAPSPGDTLRHTRAGLLGQASGARQASELYGFNPVTLLGVSSPMMAPQGDNSMMGQGIANAGAAIADGIDEFSRQKIYAQKLEEQNTDLRKALERQTLRPSVPGIYQARTGTVGAGGAGGTVDTPEIEQTRVFVGGEEVERTPGTSDADAAETAWGDWGGGLFGLGIMAMDMGHNARRVTDYLEITSPGPRIDKQAVKEGAREIVRAIKSGDPFQPYMPDPNMNWRRFDPNTRDGYTVYNR